MHKLSENEIIQYFKRNNKICLNIEEKSILLDSRLINKDSIIRRLCYLVNNCGWVYNWFNTFIPISRPQRITKIETYCNTK